MHNYRGIRSVVKVSEIKVEKRVNLTYLVFLSLVVEALLHFKGTLDF